MKIKYARLEAWRNNGMTWQQIADRVGVSLSTVMRAWESEDDYETRPRKKKDTPSSQRVSDAAVAAFGQPNMAKVNKALGDATADAVQLQAQLVQLIRGMRGRGVKEVVLDVEKGEARLTYHQVQTVKVSS